MRFFITLSIGLALVITTGCQTVTMVKDAKSNTAEDPSWQESQPFFLFGLVGERHIDVVKACNGQTPTMVAAQTTFLDGFLGVITIGIYTPRSLKIWCTTKGDS